MKQEQVEKRMIGKVKSVLTVVWIVTGLAVGSVQAASSDCGKASGTVERLICADPTLSKLDKELSTVYNAALKNEDKVATMRAQQKKWLLGRESICVKPNPGSAIKRKQCLQEAYRGRIDYLNYWYVPLPKPSSEEQAAAEAHPSPWHCERQNTKGEREWCEKARDAKPYKYEMRGIRGGQGYTLCELFLKNLQANAEPPQCELKIDPKYQKYFSLPQWENLDYWQYIDLVYQAELFRALTVYGHPEIKRQTKEQWLEQYRRNIYKNNLQPQLKRARFDLNGDGKTEWVLGITLGRACNPWASVGTGFGGYTFIVLKEDGKTPDFEMTRTTPSGFPFFYSSHDTRFQQSRVDPKNPVSLTYILTNHGVSNIDWRGDYTVSVSTGNQNEYSPYQGVTACEYETIKKSDKTTATK